MARKSNVFPSYLLHKQSGQARVRIGGREFLLGQYGSEESRVLYADLIAKHAGGIQIDPLAKPKRGRLPRNDSAGDPGPSVGELCLVFLRHAEGHYVRNAVPTSEISVLKSVIRPLTELYGMLAAKDFGPLALKAVRQKMVESGWCRSSVNTGVTRIRRIFKHAIANELIDSNVLDRLKCVAPLLAGRTEAHDNAPKKPVAADDIEKIRSAVSPLVCDLIDIQRLTGTRSGELLKTPCDVTMQIAIGYVQVSTDGQAQDAPSAKPRPISTSLHMTNTHSLLKPRFRPWSWTTNGSRHCPLPCRENWTESRRR